MEEQFIDQYYSYEEMVMTDTLNELAAVLKCNANAIDEQTINRFLQTYLSNNCSINFPKFSCHKLVLREAEVFYRLA